MFLLGKCTDLAEAVYSRPEILEVMGLLSYHHESAALCSGKLLLFAVLFPLGQMHCDVSIIL